MSRPVLNQNLGNSSRYSLVVGNFWGAFWNHRAFIASAESVSVNKLKDEVSAKYKNYPTWNIHSSSCRIVSLAELKSYFQKGDLDIIYMRTVDPKNGEINFIEVDFA